jgi:acyl carrier protein
MNSAATLKNISSEDVKLELKKLVLMAANINHILPQNIDDSAPLFRDGLGLDSIDLLEIAVHIEKKYGMKLQNDEGGRKAFANFAALTEAIVAHLQRHHRVTA